jgi:hypothetical protein
VEQLEKYVPTIEFGEKYEGFTQDLGKDFFVSVYPHNVMLVSAAATARFFPCRETTNYGFYFNNEEKRLVLVKDEKGFKAKPYGTGSVQIQLTHDLKEWLKQKGLSTFMEGKREKTQRFLLDLDKCRANVIVTRPIK